MATHERVTTTADGTEVYWIPEGNLGRLNHKIAQLNRRAARLGLGDITTSQVGDELRVVGQDRFMEPIKERFIGVVIEGPVVVLNGWELVASIEFTDTGNIVNTVPGKVAPVWARTTDRHCDHCHSERGRENVYIVSHVDGRTAQVGRNCLNSYIGSESGETAARMAQYLSSARMLAEDPDLYGGGYGERYYNLETVLAFSAAAIRQYGWMSRSKAQENPYERTATVERVNWQYNPRVKAEDKLHPTDADRKLAQASLQWVRETISVKDSAEVSDYEWNLGVLSQRDEIISREFGLAVSMVSAYLREQSRLTEQSRTHLDEWVGMVGKRIELSGLEMVNRRYFDGNYGTTCMMELRDEAGHTFIWWGKGATAEGTDFQPWERYGGKCTVKEHSIYRGAKQTILTRCTLEPQWCPLNIKATEVAL